MKLWVHSTRSALVHNIWPSRLKPITSLTQIEQGARLGKERAESSLKACEKMLTGIEENKTTVDEMILAITESTKAATENLNEMANIERISRQIDKIVDGISNVSIQTAMLAVNGAVEAARAGEYGKGFAVVSTDIQNLANDAAENAEQIKDQVKNIQEQINIVRKDLADILSTVMEEAQKAALTIKQLDNVRSRMSDVVLGSKRISESAGGIERSIADARAGMQQIATAAEESSHATGEAATAARQQSSSTSELASAIENIAAVADELQSI